MNVVLREALKRGVCSVADCGTRIQKPATLCRWHKARQRAADRKAAAAAVAR